MTDKPAPRKRRVTSEEITALEPLLERIAENLGSKYVIVGIGVDIDGLEGLGNAFSAIVRGGRVGGGEIEKRAHSNTLNGAIMLAKGTLDRELSEKTVNGQAKHKRKGTDDE